MTQPAPCELLQWDTAFFGFRIARVCGDVLVPERIDQIDAWCRQNGIRCLYFLARSDDATTTRLAEDNGFRLVDIRMTLACQNSGSINAARDCPGHIQVRYAHPEDVPILQAIARESYCDTRFYYDANFPRQLCELLYKTWITLSCEGYADEVLIAILDGVPVGYVSCHLDREHGAGRIGLVGVSNRVRGQGVGQMLVRSALDWFATQGVQEVTVVTQGRNCAAQRLYQRCGFWTQTVQLWYHKWYSLTDGI